MATHPHPNYFAPFFTAARLAERVLFAANAADLSSEYFFITARNGKKEVEQLAFVTHDDLLYSNIIAQLIFTTTFCLLSLNCKILIVSCSLLLWNICGN